ncbi:thioesterase II family protein [Streptomyces sp. NRRL F-6492]|uniref:thioesterase II family protein n=1 Tax=Streptomyces sp. NRRL F-6492 TaxID=1519497 RepID=UPI0006AFE5B9|nr:alpha/beta fold hydrolase [Streptomyces sp. NRRL F-6492]KOX50641.1 oleoyl-ACP hydrolase [Streptomyces sp. NRRL F-6492]
MTAQTEDLWIRNFHPAPDAAVRLVCFPHAGGSASFYFPVSRALAPGADVFVAQYPGRQDRRTEPVVTDIGELADRIADDLAARADDRPIVLFGHSMGALVAFEVAHRLRARGAGPASLVVSGRRAPHLYRDDAVHRRSDDGLVAELKDLSGTDAGLLGDDEILRMILPAIRGDYRAVETYRLADGTAPLDCPVLALVGDSDPRVDVDEVRGWERHTTADFALAVLPGGHFYLVQEQAAVLAALRERIAALPASPLPVAG